MNNCSGCGIELQTKDKNKPGYVTNGNSDICERCFRIKNYNNHEIDSTIMNNEDILNKINSKDLFTLFLVDFLSLNKKNIDYFNRITNSKILIVTKCDIIPKNAVLEKIEQRIKSIYNIKKLLFFSVKNGFGKNQLLDLIEKQKRVLLCGPTNGGKSSLINYLYGSKLTVSNFKNTTQDFISQTINESIIIDAPGLNDNDVIDNIKQSGYIVPKIIKLNKNYVMKILDYEFYSQDDINVTLFLPNNITFKSFKIKEDFGNLVEIKNSNDVLINNIGFIHFKNGTNIYMNKINNIEVRKSLIG